MTCDQFKDVMRSAGKREPAMSELAAAERHMQECSLCNSMIHTLLRRMIQNHPEAVSLVAPQAMEMLAKLMEHICTDPEEK